MYLQRENQSKRCCCTSTGTGLLKEKTGLRLYWRVGISGRKLLKISYDPYDGKFDVFSTKFQADLDEVIATMHSMSFYLGYLSEASDRLPKEEKVRLLKKYESFHNVNEAFNFVKSLASKISYNNDTPCPTVTIIKQHQNESSHFLLD